MIPRPQVTEEIQAALGRSRIVALLGPRQCGKTTLARQFVQVDSPCYFDLEDPISLARLAEPMLALRNLEGLVVIDEIQRRPDLFPVLRVLADRDPLPARFLILGSASPDLLRQSSESLAGRLALVEMSGFAIPEVEAQMRDRLWLRGGFPLSFLAPDDDTSYAWRKDFVRLLLERDLPHFGVSVPAATLYRFWSMAAHYHGHIWNGAEIARSLGVGESSVRRYLDLLTDLLMIRQLPPYHANLGKRQVKAPKILFRDSGLFHTLCGIRTHEDLLLSPKCGASWEGHIIEETLRCVKPDEAFHWATHNGAEIDLVLLKDGRMAGVECKRADAPRLTKSMRMALADLGLEQIVVVYPGDRTYSLSERIQAIPDSMLETGMAQLFSGRKPGIV